MAADPNWTPAETLSFAPPGSQQVAVAATGDVVHLVWVHSKTLYHSRRIDGAWEPSVKVAGGEQPALAAAPDGTLYCIYANWFLGNRDIYLSVFADGKWSLSQVVSRTPGESSDPAICVGPDGIVHAAWADTTSGESMIYYGHRDATGWSYAEVPNGRGSRPSIATSAPEATGPVYVAWQDRRPTSTVAAYDVYATEKRGSAWSYPTIVSDTPDLHSLLPSISAFGDDKCHLVWQEERNGLYVIRHSDLWPNGWETPVDVSDPSSDARLGHAVADKLGLFQFVWSEGALLKHRVRPGEPQGQWWPPEVACDDCAGLSELSAAISANGELHVVFTRFPNANERQYYYLRRKALERKKITVPLPGR